MRSSAVTQGLVLAAAIILSPLILPVALVGVRVESTSSIEKRVPAGPNLDELRRLFKEPPDDTRIMMRWWWFGPTVTEPELEREMRLMKEGGIGGFEVQPVYPLSPDDPALGIKNLPYLSDEFIDALRFVSLKARELGLRMDLTLGSGWPFGGPQVSISDAAGMLRTERVKTQP